MSKAEPRTPVRVVLESLHSGFLHDLTAFLAVLLFAFGMFVILDKLSS
jgi:hypothetical protein